MSTPNDLDQLLVGDLISSARQKLLTALSAANFLGTVVGTDSAGGAYTDGWVFPGLDNDGRPFRNVEGTGKAAVVLHDRSSWGVNAHNTARFPSITALIYADTSRQADGQPASRDADLRCKAVAAIVRKTFHDAANEDHTWPNGLSVISSVESTPLSIGDVPDGDGLVRGEIRFDVALLG